MDEQQSIAVSFDSLSRMPGEISKLLHLFSAKDLNWKPASWDGIPGEKFSALEQICHLRDIENDGYHKRIEAMLHENNPTLASIEGYELAVQRHYKDENLDAVIDSFCAAREKTIAVIKNIKSDQWNNPGYFEGYGVITLSALIHFLCSHDFEHLASLRWLLGKLEGERLN